VRGVGGEEENIENFQQLRNREKRKQDTQRSTTKRKEKLGRSTLGGNFDAGGQFLWWGGWKGKSGGAGSGERIETGCLLQERSAVKRPKRVMKERQGELGGANEKGAGARLCCGYMFHAGMPGEIFGGGGGGEWA